MFILQIWQNRRPVPELLPTKVTELQICAPHLWLGVFENADEAATSVAIFDGEHDDEWM